MNDERFARLMESVKQAGEIRRGERIPGRIFEFSPLDVKTIQSQPQKAQSEIHYLRLSPPERRNPQ